MIPDHSWACVVAFHDPATRGPKFRRYKGMLFGLPLAVSAFNRLPLLLQSLGRRFLGVLINLYFDDLTQQDWSLLAVETQHLVAELFEMFGFPFAPNKRQSPSSSGDFLGLHHDLSSLRTTGNIRVWVRQRLVDKVMDMINTARQSNSFRPGQASKLFGCVTCLDQGVFGRVARAGLDSVKDRQYSAGRVSLTPDLRQAFDTIQTIIELRPQVFGLCAQVHQSARSCR